MLNALSISQVMILDIETVPQYQYYADMPENLQMLWEKKTHYQRGAEQTPAEFYERAGILAEFGKIICISMGVFDIHNKTYKIRVKSIYGDDEATLLRQFSALLSKQSKDLIFCAHNGKEFDYPYLCRRMLINSVKIPAQLQISGKKPWEIKHLDTMELWKFGDHKHYTSLDLLATVLQIPTSKDDIDGSEVRKVYYEDKNLQRIATYCQKDVITTAQVLLRYKGLPIITSENITLVA